MRLFGAFEVTAGCPPELELTRAISLGPTAALSAHLAVCARCVARSRALAGPRELVRQLPWRAPSAAVLEQTRTALLASLAVDRGDAASASRRGRRVLVLAVPFAMAAGAVVVWQVAPRNSRSRTVSVSAPTPSATRAGPAAVLAPSRVPDPELRAAPPRVETRVHGTSVRTKVAGDRRETPLRPSPSETAFVEAWTAFRAGRYGGAIDAFDDVLRLEPTGPLAEDARYWRAVARARTGARDAVDDLATFLRQYPHSAHADEASLLLGWKLIEADRREEAARSFQDALRARTPETRAKAREGLAAAGRRP